MTPEQLKADLEGCYVTIPTPFADTEDFPVNEEALRSYVRFLTGSGLTRDYATFLAGGAAGDFSTMTFDERMRVAEIVLDEVNGQVPVAVGAQTTSTLELKRLAKRASELGASFIQVSCPYYFTHTEADFECPSSDDLGRLSAFQTGGSGSPLIDVTRFQFRDASAGRAWFFV